MEVDSMKSKQCSYKDVKVGNARGCRETLIYAIWAVGKELRLSRLTKARMGKTLNSILRTYECMDNYEK